ncbi:MAG: cell division protein SepF [Firmicutes bacterium HGW-Firmicutes-15]|nr:MAG: cell division protein SepF [Firmicutes bacterium HGW-Firmicutes-15]
MGVIDNLWKWLGVQTEVEEEYQDLPVLPERENKLGANIVSIHSGKNLKVIVCEPERFEEVQALADHLKNRKQIILNFEATPPDVSQKIIDFISGAVYSLDGQSQQLGHNIFLFAPSSVEITTDHKTLMRKHDQQRPETYGGKR